MNSLEFIDEEIKYCKKELEENKQNCLVNKNDKALVIGRNLYLREKLRALNQIKSELEAWYVVKENTIITDNRCDVDRIEMYKGGKGYEIFKKALGVEE